MRLHKRRMSSLKKSPFLATNEKVPLQWPLRKGLGEIFSAQLAGLRNRTSLRERLTIGNPGAFGFSFIGPGIETEGIFFEI